MSMNLVNREDLKIGGKKDEDGNFQYWYIGVPDPAVRAKYDKSKENMMEWARRIADHHKSFTCEHILKVYDIEIVSSHLIFFQEPCDTTLINWMSQKHSFSSKIEVLLDLACKLKDLKSHKIIHRNLKPEIIGIKFKKNKKSIKFCLLQQAVQLNEEKKKISLPKQLNKYTAPELKANQNHGFGVDVWSYGAIFYEVIFGVEVRYYHCSQILYPFQIPLWLKEIINKMLATNLKERYNIEDVVDRLKNLSQCSEVIQKILTEKSDTKF